MQLKDGSYTYDRCLQCPRLGHGCGGPNTLCMDLERWCEWLRSLKRLRGLTVQIIAEGTGISETTLQRIFSPHPPKDIRRETASILTKFLVGSSSQWPCLSAEKEFEEHTAEAELRARDAEKLCEFYKAELDESHRSGQEKVDFLRKEVEFLREEILKKDEIISQLLRAR